MSKIKKIFRRRPSFQTETIVLLTTEALFSTVTDVPESEHVFYCWNA